MPAEPTDFDFDIAEFDTHTLAETGMKMPLLDLRTGLPRRRRDGVPVTITLLGRQSDAFRDTLHKIQTARVTDRLNTDKPVESDAQRREREDRDFLIACTADWSFTIMDGKPFTCTPGNIRKFWNDRRFRSLHESGIAFIMADANFLAPLPDNLANTPAITSSSPALSPTAAAA